MRMVDPYLPEETRFRRHFLIATTALAAVLGIVLVSWPEIDLALSRAMQVCPDAPSFAPWCETDPAVATLRKVFMALTVIIAAAVLFGAGRTIWERGGLVGLAQARWCFLAAMLAIGPGLVANVILKDNWGRARPRQVVEFGGTKQFTPPLVPVRECVRNCSFVSGEASVRLCAVLRRGAAPSAIPLCADRGRRAVRLRRRSHQDEPGRPLSERRAVRRHLHGADRERAPHPLHRALARAQCHSLCGGVLQLAWAQIRPPRAGATVATAYGRDRCSSIAAGRR